MATYPGAIYATPSRNDADMSAATDHETWHDQEVDEIRAVQTELGTTPSGAFATVKARLDEFDTAETSWSPGLNGSAETVLSGGYAQLGPLVFGEVVWELSGGVAGDLSFTLPVAAERRGILGSAHLIDTSGTRYLGVVVVLSDSSASALIRAVNASTTVAQETIMAAGVPFTWVSGDFISARFQYLVNV